MKPDEIRNCDPERAYRINHVDYKFVSGAGRPPAEPGGVMTVAEIRAILEEVRAGRSTRG